MIAPLATPQNRACRRGYRCNADAPRCRQWPPGTPSPAGCDVAPQRRAAPRAAAAQSPSNLVRTEVVRTQTIKVSSWRENGATLRGTVRPGHATGRRAAPSHKLGALYTRGSHVRRARGTPEGPRGTS